MNICVIFGGKSTENAVSCMSAASVLRNIKNGHEVTKIGITEDGNWFKTEALPDEIEAGLWNKRHDNIAVTVSFNEKSFICGKEKIYPDIIFPVLHGLNGEDGTIQGLFEMMGVPYVGCHVLASSVCMDKITAKKVFYHEEIDQADWAYVELCDFNEDEEAVCDFLDARFDYPFFIKPSNAGSSVGITKCHNFEEIKPALKLAFSVDRRVVVEEGITNAIEAEVAVLGNKDPIASVVGRIIPANEFYDYEAKYKNESSKLIIPAGLEYEDQIKTIALNAYEACDCNGMARVDFLIGEDGHIYLNEINTIPGFTQISMFSKLFAASGIAYDELIEILIKHALEYENGRKL